MKKILFYSGLIIAVGVAVFSCNKEETTNPVTQQQTQNGIGNYKSASIEDIYLKDIEQSDGSINDVHIKVIKNPSENVQTKLVITKTVLNENSPQDVAAVNGLIIDKGITLTAKNDTTTFTIPEKGTYWMISDNGDVVEKLASGDCYTLICKCLSTLGPSPACKLVHYSISLGLSATCDPVSNCGDCTLFAIKCGTEKKNTPLLITTGEKIMINGKIYE